jgi:hypothetical protein
MYQIIKWPEEMAPSRCPIHFTNELEVSASPETIWSLLLDTKAWDKFYPGVEHVQLLDGAETLGFGTWFETSGGPGCLRLRSRVRTDDAHRLGRLSQGQ